MQALQCRKIIRRPRLAREYSLELYIRFTLLTQGLVEEKRREVQFEPHEILPQFSLLNACCSAECGQFYSKELTVVDCLAKLAQPSEKKSLRLTSDEF